MNFLVANNSLIFALLTGFVGVLGFLVNQALRLYGMERDIRHLKRDYQSLSKNLHELMTDYERRLDESEKEMIQIRCISLHLSARLAGSNSGSLLNFDSENHRQ